MFVRANGSLGANWSLHDLRHTAAYRMAEDPALPLTDVQFVYAEGLNMGPDAERNALASAHDQIEEALAA